jgi:outer membrane protein OmpA-like peptidoglycan-associated protein
MRFRWMTVLLLSALAGCTGSGDEQAYSVYFQPYSADPDPAARETIHAAADFARSHRTLPVVVVGYSAPPDPGRDVDGLSAQRAEGVKRVLVAEGVEPNRISTTAHGVIDPKNLPTVAERRVDIAVGRGDGQ